MLSVLENVLIEEEINPDIIGKRYILPSSFNWGPGHSYQNYQDGMAICTSLEPPDYFITFTCNPTLPKITEALKSIPTQKV